MSDDMKQLRAELQQNGYALYQYDDAHIYSFPHDAPWLTDETFSEVYEKVRHHTLVDRVRCYALYQLAQQAKKVPGDILEVGVWRGGTAALLAVTSGKVLYAADTFTGVVKSADWETYVDNAHSDADAQTVTDLFDKADVKDYKLLTGIFPEDTGKAIEGKQFSLVHIDVDVYQSAKDTFNFVWGKVSPGGIVVFDDYGFITACIGVYKFVNEIKDDKDKLFIHNQNGQAYIVKVSQD